MSIITLSQDELLQVSGADHDEANEPPEATEPAEATEPPEANEPPEAPGDRG